MWTCFKATMRVWLACKVRTGNPEAGSFACFAYLGSSHLSASFRPHKSSGPSTFFPFAHPPILSAHIYDRSSLFGTKVEDQDIHLLSTLSSPLIVPVATFKCVCRVRLKGERCFQTKGRCSTVYGEQQPWTNHE